MVPEMSSFVSPKELLFEGNQLANWNLWKSQFETFMTATESDKKSDKIRVCMLLNLIGERGNEIYQTFTWTTAADKFLYAKVIEAFDGYFSVRKNLTVSRYRFLSLNQNDLTIDEFITEQVAGDGFRGPLLICLLNLTLNKKSASHTLQFASKYHVFLI